jgi:1-acyl-sn-glycerol-3-phosphate acyltransferase
MPIDFRPIARLLTHTVHPAPSVDLSAVDAFLPRMEQERQGKGVLITVNHYSAPDFKAWWLAIIISAVFPAKIHWVVTSVWTNSDWLTGFTHWLFPCGARMLGFTPMPAMPPDPAEAEQRAVAVRKVLRYARHTPQPVIGMAPEGRDIPGGILGTLPPGVGRFMYLLNQSCPQVLPIGVWKYDGRINLKFGSPYQLEVPTGISAHECDKLVGDTVMRHIALCLPERLRREY